MLYKKICQSFAVKTENVLRDIKDFNQKATLKQTIGDKRNLQKFLETQVKEGKLRSSLQKSSRYDAEFSDFLKKYQEKHKEYPNILDLSHYTREQSSFEKNSEQRQEELMMLNEFRKRQSKKYSKFNNLDDEEIPPEIRTKMDLEDEDFEKSKQDDTVSEETRLSESRIKTMKESIFGRDDFITLMIANDTTTLITKLNRINHFRYLVFAGNGNGVIGYGKGKGNDMEQALSNALLNLKKNLIAIPLDHFNSFTGCIKTSFNGFELRLFPRNAGMNAWGNPLIAHMLVLSGITDVRFKCIFRNLNPYALVYAYMDAVTQNRTPQELSELFGRKVYRQYWGRPALIDNIPAPGNMF